MLQINHPHLEPSTHLGHTDWTLKKSVKYDPVKLQKFRESLKPKSPNQITKPNTQPLRGNHNNISTKNHSTSHKELDPKIIKISLSGNSPKAGQKRRKPSSMILDQKTYKAICSRRKTDPPYLLQREKLCV